MGAAEIEPATKPQSARQLRFKRDDIVRFRKRSQIAAGLGVGLDKEFRVEMSTRDEGRTMVVLRVGRGKHSALVKVPLGHLAIVERSGEIPNSIRACAARLAQFKGPLTPDLTMLAGDLRARNVRWRARLLHRRWLPPMNGARTTAHLGGLLVAVRTG